MSTKIRIGSRDSDLAKWQAKEVQSQLTQNKIESDIIWIKSQGDLIQDIPLHTIGTVGVFTKALDDALLAGEIDIAVHSCKDLPSTLHPNLKIFAYLKREDARDLLVSNHVIEFIDDANFSGTIATGSVRRRAQILASYPNATVVGLRGNVPTRLKKLKNSDWDGAVFAYAGLKRLGIEPEHKAFLDKLVPAPAQGVVAIVGRSSDKMIENQVRQINDDSTQKTTIAERTFLRLMEGGCISPIGAHAILVNENIQLKVSVLSTNGDQKIEFEESHDDKNPEEVATSVFKQAKQLGAVTLIQEIEKNA